jgi:DnaJ-class molecular chaperone
MNCPVCHGKGYLVDRDNDEEPTWEWHQVLELDFSENGMIVHYTCPGCHGSGIIHCCDGLQEQP